MVSLSRGLVCVLALLLVSGSSPAAAPTKEEATAVLQLAYASYCGASTLTPWTCYWCNPQLTQVTTVSDTAERLLAYAAIREQTSQIVVAFRGTVNDADLTTNTLNNLADMAVTLTPLTSRIKSVRAHFGWTSQWDQLRPSLLSTLRRLRLARPRHTLLLTGHSSGAAASMIAALALVAFEQGDDHWEAEQIEILNFGCPRVGNAAFASAFADAGLATQTWRFVALVLCSLLYCCYHCSLSIL